MRRLILAALLVLLAAPPALAQQQVRVTHVYKLLAGTLYRPAIDDTITAQNALTAAQQADGAHMKFTAESTAVFSVSGFTHVTLWLRGIPAATDTSTLLQVAILPKEIMSDGSNPFNADTVAVYDSLAAAPSPPEVSAGFGAGAPPAGSGPGAWPGEIVKTIDPWNGRSVVTTGKSNRFFGLSTVTVDLSAEAKLVRQGSGLMQVRVRVLNYNSTVTKKARIQSWVTGAD